MGEEVGGGGGRWWLVGIGMGWAELVTALDYRIEDMVVGGLTG
jgi:hypothetical protein